MPPVRTETQERMKAAVPALLVIHHKYAARVARQATLLHLAAKKLHALQRALEKEATAAAGKGFRSQYQQNIPCIYHVCIMYMPCEFKHQPISLGYTQYMM
jgi:hypothetical protein